MNKFEEYSEKVKNLAGNPTNEEKLLVYGLYKQAIEGDNTKDEPWSIQIEAKAKWVSWEKNRGMNEEEAKTEYINLVESLIEKYGLKN